MLVFDQKRQCKNRHFPMQHFAAIASATNILASNYLTLSTSYIVRYKACISVCERIYIQIKMQMLKRGKWNKTSTNGAAYCVTKKANNASSGCVTILLVRTTALHKWN